MANDSPVDTLRPSANDFGRMAKSWRRVAPSGYHPAMTPSEKNVVKSLVAVAWADGTVKEPEEGVITGLLVGFDATEDEEKELLEYARTRRTLSDVPLGELGQEDRELLLANAALLTHADGEQSEGEKALLDKLVKLLGFAPEEAESIILSAGDGALTLNSRVLREL